MALAAVKTWVAAEVLFASDLNAMNTNILNNALSLISPLPGNLDAGSFDITNLDELEFDDAAADPTASTTPRVRNNAGTFKVRVQDNRTATVARPFGIIADTSGAPAANLGVGMLFEAKSGDEAPSQFGATDFVATDVTAGSEDTVFDVSLRTAGAALGTRYRFQSTGAFLYTITGAPTAARTITLPDADATIGTAPAAATQAEMEAATSTTVYVSPGRTQYHPGVAKGWSLHTDAGADTASYNVTSITDTGVGDHTVNWGTDFSSGNHCDVASAGNSGVMVALATLAAGTTRLTGFGADTPFSAADLLAWTVVSYGDQA